MYIYIFISLYMWCSAIVSDSFFFSLIFSLLLFLELVCLSIGAALVAVTGRTTQRRRRRWVVGKRTVSETKEGAGSE